MHLFLSPHADDAVFSCGAQIGRAVRNGDQAMIYTITAGEVPAGLRPTPFVQELHARWGLGEALDAAAINGGIAWRRAEDAEAARLLGAEIAFGPHADAIYRVNLATGDALYPDREAIFAAIDPHDPLTPAAMEAALAKSLTAIPGTIYAPLGVGNHVDHQLTRALGLTLAERYPESRVYFYEEYPYAREGRAAIQKALRDFNQPLMRLAGHMNADLLETKIKASACYASQVSSFWADENALAEDLRAYHAATGSEGIWRLLRQDKSEAS